MGIKVNKSVVEEKVWGCKRFLTTMPSFNAYTKKGNEVFPVTQTKKLGACGPWALLEHSPNGVCFQSGSYNVNNASPHSMW